MKQKFFSIALTAAVAAALLSGAATVCAAPSEFPPLPAISFTAADPENTRRLPTKKIEHSYGIPKNGRPNQISVDNQAYFDKCGYSAFAYDNKTKEKVLYLTFDCGYENGNTHVIMDALKERNIPAAFFCTLFHMKSEPELIARMIREGHIVGNHTDRHPDFSEISRDRMVQEILACENYLREMYGYSSPYFRFPKGTYTECALELVDSMGMTSVFWSSSYEDWDTEKTKGREFAFDCVTSRLHPGAVILLHSVSPDNAAAIGDIIDYAVAQGYTFRPLTKYGK
ncbi:MAG: polysaccharide deacetylase family protein [Oscillospiraceae bacterium]|nr:polysaccharide deacetylase family protein [Oscillospiraceae bacterium]